MHVRSPRVHVIPTWQRPTVLARESIIQGEPKRAPNARKRCIIYWVLDWPFLSGKVPGNHLHQSYNENLISEIRLGTNEARALHPGLLCKREGHSSIIPKCISVTMFHGMTGTCSCSGYKAGKKMACSVVVSQAPNRIIHLQFAIRNASIQLTYKRRNRKWGNGNWRNEEMNKWTGNGS